MLIGITENIQETKRVGVVKQINLVTTLLLFSLFLPFLIYIIFYFGIVTGKSVFNSDIQEPVAKVITQSGVGTAFLISPTLLLTARHVVENNKIGDEVDLIFDHSKSQLQTKAKVKYIAQTSIQSVGNQVSLDYFLTDVAVLEVSSISDIAPLVLGSSDTVNNLDDVILIGFPNGDYSITKGSINNVKYQGLNLFKLDATSNRGNSGGPCILKNDNTVIGILVGSNATAKQGENVALKIDDVKRLLENAKISY